ncbi:hypothetical protein EYZ11_002708 [Aspergillus tanneri]|uniref:Laccase, multicopper oxidase, benzenediol:oxygen oxidorectuctase n=1 Tax=Aspergillus tanneri TaxID=1220188 RepID=A0A4S3JQ60_9EURO|nr:hypothetical protein EYZ11_002708 [Aspergillus tanneri]
MNTLRYRLVWLTALLLSLAPWANANGQQVNATRNTVRYNLTLTWDDWAPAGTSRKMILTNGQFPGPELRLQQGDDVEVLVVNNLPDPATIHFHGIEQINTPWSDGTPGLSQKNIAPGGRFLYKWHAAQYGSYIYHAHSRGQMDDGLYGAIYIQPNDNVEKPFGQITDNKGEINAMHEAEKKSAPVVLSDWRQLTSEEIWHAEEEMGRDAMCANALLVNGKGSVSCLSRQALDTATTPEQRKVLGNTSFTDIGCLPPTNALAQGNFPHNLSAIPPSVFSGCTPSHGSTEKLLVDQAAQYVSYDLISAAGISVITFSIDEHPMYVYAVDGRYVVPNLVDALTVPNGARYSVMVKLDKPAGDYTVRVVNTGVNQILNTTAIMSYKTSQKTQQQPSTPCIDITGRPSTNCKVLDEGTIVPFPVEVPAKEVAQTHVLNIDHYHASYLWTMGNSSYPLSLEESSPLLFDPSAAKTDLSIKTLNGTWVDLVFHVVSSLQPPHPIHKHSNKFFVIGQGNGAWKYSSVAEAMKVIPESFNLKNPQIRDTFVTPPAATGPTWLVIRYQVINPGAFFLHCHLQIHLSGGMGLALLDGVDHWPEIPVEYQGDNAGFPPKELSSE